MSQRRKVGDIVQVRDDNGDYHAKIVHHGRGIDPDSCILECDDPNCGEWPVLEIISVDDSPVGERVFHVPECRMSSPDAL